MYSHARELFQENKDKGVSNPELVCQILELVEKNWKEILVSEETIIQMELRLSKQEQIIEMPILERIQNLKKSLEQ